MGDPQGSVGRFSFPLPCHFLFLFLESPFTFHFLLLLCTLPPTPANLPLSPPPIFSFPSLKHPLNWKGLWLSSAMLVWKLQLSLSPVFPSVLPSHFSWFLLFFPAHQLIHICSCIYLCHLYTLPFCIVKMQSSLRPSPLQYFTLTTTQLA